MGSMELESSAPTRLPLRLWVSRGGEVGSLRKAVRPSDNNINLWGMTFSFDEEGNVFYPLGIKQVVGHLQVPSKKGSANK